MNKLFYAGVLGCVLATAAIAADPETAIVPSHQWVEPVNLDADDSSCSISYGDKIFAVGREGDAVLARVETDGRGARCEKGTLFFVDESEFSTMTERYNTVRKAKQDRDALVERILKGAK